LCHVQLRDRHRQIHLRGWGLRLRVVLQVRCKLERVSQDQLEEACQWDWGGQLLGWGWVDHRLREVRRSASHQDPQVGFLEEPRHPALLDEEDHLLEDHRRVLVGHHLDSELLARLEECHLGFKVRRVKAEGFRLVSEVVR
jgi:hypothetical protein